MSIGGPSSFIEDDSSEKSISPNGAYYVPERDGTILEYLSKFEEERTPRAFKTFEQFEMLVNAGVLVEELAEMYIIRLYYADGTDQFYTLCSLEECEGAEVNVHAGKPGTHTIKDILTQGQFRHWEISGIDPKFLRKTSL